MIIAFALSLDGNNPVVPLLIWYVKLSLPAPGVVIRSPFDDNCLEAIFHIPEAPPPVNVGEYEL